ncbi:hypothetical protein [Paenibacillus lautus]|uniref:hypothetical protein n=1 Tax=Paenibacillus lautus TaxID=1401 RepID=UPI003987B08F
MATLPCLISMQKYVVSIQSITLYHIIFEFAVPALRQVPVLRFIRPMVRILQLILIITNFYRTGSVSYNRETFEKPDLGRM